VPTRIRLPEDGPMLVRGNLDIDGKPETRAALCRCGESANNRIATAAGRAATGATSRSSLDPNVEALTQARPVRGRVRVPHSQPETDAASSRVAGHGRPLCSSALSTTPS
jgi:CDGSH-type Zn-finger protein